MGSKFRHLLLKRKLAHKKQRLMKTKGPKAAPKAKK
jgi:hypothetical protein